MSYQQVGFIVQDEPDGTWSHTQVMECSICGALVSATSFATHDQWHFDNTVTPS